MVRIWDCSACSVFIIAYPFRPLRAVLGAAVTVNCETYFSHAPLGIFGFLHAFLYGATGLLTIWLWMLPGIAIYGLFGLIQAKINAKRNASAQELQAATFEQFLIDRAPVTST